MHHIKPLPSVEKKIASQMDVFPMVMGLLRLDFVNNTMGIDLTG